MRKGNSMINQDLVKTQEILKKELGIKNLFELPKLSKIVINMGVKDVLIDKKNIEKGIEIMKQISGQRPKITKAKKAIAGFKLREGDSVGLVLTLRGKRMHDFFKKLVTIVFPRLRDFHGVSRDSFDGHGNYTLGFTETTVFPEIDPGKIDTARAGQGLEVVIVTTAKDNKSGFALLSAMGMPFKKVSAKGGSAIG